jgi:hypothetical protein
MADQTASTRFQALFDSAVHAYEKNTGVTLAEHPLALQLHDCPDVQSITSLLQNQVTLFGDFRQNDRIMKLIESTVSILGVLSSTVALGGPIGLVIHNVRIGYSTCLTAFKAFPPVEIIQTGLAVLLSVSPFLISRVRILLTPIY